ncbi:protein TIFY 9 [Rosa rugosa]|uniref:protein TIFY 9 n=1 Tax=Rosa rugosa TaxID=74645 RepID=UPI002B414E9D|nr:protein TIFY 9 [Rosa rugosa]
MYTPAAATVELDFLGVGTTTIMDQHRHNQQRGGGGDTFSTALPKSPFQKFLERGRSFRGIQAREVIPNLLSSEVLKSVIAARKSVAAAPENSPEKPKAKPMTIFYGGSVSVFDVTPDKFESIVKLAMEEKFKAAGAADHQPLEPKQQQLVNVEDPLNEDLPIARGKYLPIARGKSLQRFLEKRKERLNTVSPYGCHTTNC